MTTTVHDRVVKLTAASARRVIDPDAELVGHLGEGQLLPDCLLSTAGLDVDLSPHQRATLAREEVASLFRAGIRFEAVLAAGFSAHIASAGDVTDPRITFLLHEVGEETRHQRLFQRIVDEADPQAHPPIPQWLLGGIYRTITHASMELPAMFDVLVLGGEEIPDLLQKLASNHDTTDPFLREVNRYHRLEEARHLSFARAIFPEVWARAGQADRRAVRHVAPRVIRLMFDMLVHPGVYPTVGLPARETWLEANRSPLRRALRHAATRPILEVLVAEGALERGQLPKGWRQLCGVNRFGVPVGPDPADVTDCVTCAAALAG